MLPRERVEAALAHQEPDLVPWGEHSIDYTTYEMVLGRESFVQGKFKLNQALWDGRRDEIVESDKRDRVDLIRALGMDIATVTRCPEKGSHPSPLEKVDHETYRDGRGSLFRISATTHDLMPYKIRTDDYVVPTVDSLQAQIDQVISEGVARPDDSVWEVARHVMDELQDTHWINTCIGDIGFPAMGPTDEERYLNLALHPELHAKSVELQARRAIATLPLYAELGFDSVMPCGDLGTSTALLCSPDLLRDHVVEWWKVFTDEAKRLGLRIIKHCCGSVWEAMDYIVEGGYEGYEGIQASGGMDMKRLKEEYGDKLVLWGGVWNEHLIGGSVEDIMREGKYAIKWGAPGGGFIYGATHSLAVGTKFENLMAMKECRETWGKYPISVTD